MNIDTIKRKLWAVTNLSHLARDAGVGLRTVRRLKNGDHGVTYATLEKLAAALRKR